ncbi:hypothetical protein INT45_004365 [Circinella minor]|uniref:Conserved oligomeric Golgi complex subunit 1 n=1 Tax=Circinella minor TaxID=1195481 RepID=A0A8H7S9F4_9FUNG|nr:hypothetical protein INT45_004365 [Circinella minor]
MASPPFDNNTELNDDDPDSLLVKVSVSEVRGIEKRTRMSIETQKQELRSMVGEQYLDLISAADAIIAMSKNAHSIQNKLDRMEAACDVSTIRQKAAEARTGQNEEVHDQKRRYVYALASLIKSLADVPEQIWHALENHKYLHGARLYELARIVYEYLDSESDDEINIQAAFPVVQRQWDAVSFFRSQIIQKSISYLRNPDQTSENVAETLTCLMLLDNQTYFETMEHLLDSRTAAITDLVTTSITSSTTTTTTKKQQQHNQQQQSRLAYQLKEVIQIIQRTLIHIYEIYTKNQWVTHYVEEIEKNFMSTKTPAITRVFSPSTNAHLLMRYLPESIQNYTPHLSETAGEHVLSRDVQQFAQSWLQNMEELLQTHLSSLLQQITSHAVLVDVRSKLWEFLGTDNNTTLNRRSGMMLSDKKGELSTWSETCQHLLEQHYSIWDSLLREAFNTRAKELIDENAKILSDQPQQVIWRKIESRDALTSRSLNSTSLPLPNSSATKAIDDFKKTLNDASQGRSPLIQDLQYSFDNILQTMRTDLEHHQLNNTEKDQFQCKTDTNMIKKYFQDACFNSITTYTVGLNNLLDELKNWTDEKAANKMSIFVGRLARTIAISSKELPRVITLTKSATLELKSGVDKGISIKLDYYNISHGNWISTMATEFGKSLSAGLIRTKWNDECSAAIVWADVGDGDIKLPIQATSAIELAVYHICVELQHVNSALLDKFIMQNLRQQLTEAMIKCLSDFYKGLQSSPDMITEKGAIQLIFDILFMNLVFQEGVMTDSLRKIMDKTKEFIDPINWAAFEPHFLPNAERFCLKQTLLFGVLTRPNREAFERSRKVASQQQQQHNVLPMVSQAPRFTLLPIGHLTSTIKA